MEKGHLGLRELLVVALLIVGLTTSVFLLTDKQLASGVSTSPQESEAEIEFNDNVWEIFAQGKARADSRFYDTDPHGTYRIRTFRWSLGSMDDSPDTVPIKENDLRAAPVRFNDRYDDALRGFAFTTYQKVNLSGPPLIFGTAVFISEQNIIENYVESGESFDMRYDPHPERSQIIEDCSVIYSSSMVTQSGTPVQVYDVGCRIVYGAHP